MLELIIEIVSEVAELAIDIISALFKGNSKQRRTKREEYERNIQEGKL